MDFKIISAMVFFLFSMWMANKIRLYLSVRKKVAGVMKYVWCCKGKNSSPQPQPVCTHK